MDKEQKLLANQAINRWCEDTTAREIIRYVMNCEIWGQDNISPSNEYLADKFGWTQGTTRVAISTAKKSQFITTTGRGKSRTFELNVGFLKGKMAEIAVKNIRPKISFDDVLPNNSPNKLPNKLPNKVPNNLNEEYGLIEPQNEQNEGDSNSNSNRNKAFAKQNASFLEPYEEIREEEDRPKKRKPNRNPEVIKLRDELYDMFEKAKGVRTMPNFGDYTTLQVALTRMTPEQVKDMVEYQLDYENPVTLRNALTNYKVNKYLQENI